MTIFYAKSRECDYYSSGRNGVCLTTAMRLRSSNYFPWRFQTKSNALLNLVSNEICKLELKELYIRLDDF